MAKTALTCAAILLVLSGVCMAGDGYRLVFADDPEAVAEIISTDDTLVPFKAAGSGGFLLLTADEMADLGRLHALEIEDLGSAKGFAGRLYLASGHAPKISGRKIFERRGFVLVSTPRSDAPLDFPGAEEINMRGLRRLTRHHPGRRVEWDPYVQNLVDQVTETGIGNTIQRLADFQTRYTFSDSVHSAAQWIADEFASMGYTDIVMDEFTYSSTTQHNVVVTKPGGGTPDKIVIVDGHYDSVSEDPYVYAPGADDNGSGAASVLEIARAIKDVSLDYTVRFICFAAEEQGLHGSTHYADYAQSTGMDIELLINLDMIGFPNTGPWDIIVERDEGNSVSHNDSASQYYASVMADLAAIYTSLGTYHTDIWASDYMPFEARGYVCIGAYEAGDNPYYHSTNDTPENTNNEYVTEVARMSLASVLDAAIIFDPNPPVIAAIAETTLVEGNPVEFTVTATDEDGDSLFFGARYIPDGATFDSLYTQQFSWTPGMNQAGEYGVLFTVHDGRGRSDSTTVAIDVLDTAPNVIYTSPGAFEFDSPPGLTILAEFDQDVVDSTINDASFVAYGAFSGRHTGTVDYSPVTREATLDPGTPFMTGEGVTGVLVNTILSDAGYNLEGFSWTTTIRALGDQAPGFADTADFTAGSTPIDAALGDFDSDGDVDVAVVNLYGDQFVVLENTGGTLEYQQAYACGSGPHGIAVSDIDSDGDLDIATADYFGGTVSVLQNCAGVFSASDTLVSGSGPRDVASSDLNGDGRMDVICANGVSDNVAVFYNRVDGFASAYTFGVGDNPHSVTVSDYDLDGKPDIAVGSTGADEVQVFRNNGDETFTEKDSQSFTGDIYAVISGDIDNDGDADLLATNANTWRLMLLENDGTGDFTLSDSLTTGNNPRGLWMGDLDGDLDPDVVVTNNYSHDFTVFVGDGTGGFDVGDDWDSSNGPRAVSGADMDGDGDIDLVFAGSLADKVTLALNESATSAWEPSNAVIVSELKASCWPNPFNPDVIISYELPSSAPTSVRVFSADGRLVRTLVSDVLMDPGRYTARWDGVDDLGRSVASGVYFYEVLHKDVKTSAKMVLLK